MLALSEEKNVQFHCPFCLIKPQNDVKLSDVISFEAFGSVLNPGQPRAMKSVCVLEMVNCLLS